MRVLAPGHVMSFVTLARHVFAACALLFHLLAAVHLRRLSSLSLCDRWNGDRQRDRSKQLFHVNLREIELNVSISRSSRRWSGNLCRRADQEALKFRRLGAADYWLRQKW